MNKIAKHAENYDAEMKEMEEYKFSRKVSKKKIAEWNKPVHYVYHHVIVRSEKKFTPVRIVFNNSAAFQGRCFNEYWYKGLDLFLEVILRFHANAATAIGDKSKIYHMIAIHPLTDMFIGSLGKSRKET